MTVMRKVEVVTQWEGSERQLGNQGENRLCGKLAKS